MARPKKTEDQRTLFLAGLTQGLSVQSACDGAEIGRRTAYNWRDAEPEFAKAWDAAVEAGTDVLEDEARRRAFEGVDEPAGWYQGKPGGLVRKYSDTLLMFLLNGRRPEKFNRQRIEHTGKDGKDLVIKIEDGWAK